MKKYVLDTSALLAYIENEDGVAEVQSLFDQSLDEKIELFVSVVSSIEVLYISRQEQGEEVAQERLKLIEDLPIIQEPVDERLIKIIAEIKATRAISFADCCIAGLAKFKQAALTHKDPEYEKVEDEIEQLKLPYKKKTKQKKHK
jgi:predicted nucleic acid-binding protein